MSKITLKVVKFEKSLAIQILDQDERFTADGKPTDYTDYTSYTASNGLQIKSNTRPDWSDADAYTIFLRGKDKDRDLDVSTVKFKSNEKRDKYLGKICVALKSWADCWEGFLEEPEKSGDPSIYKF